MTAALLDTALAYAADGLPVFALFEPVGTACACGRADCSSPAKHPRTLHGLKDASTDADVVREWWRRWPTANIGVRTGTPGGLVVVDLDSLEAEIRLAELAGCARSALVDPTAFGGLVVRTGRGHQLWYRARSETTMANSASKLGPGIDVRGTGGYVVAPPSWHITGRQYVFIGGRFDPPPAWLLDALVPREGTEQVETQHAVEAVAHTSEARRFGAAVVIGRCDAVRNARRPTDGAAGERNSTLLRSATICGGYIETGAMDEDEAREALLEAATDAGLTQREALATIASGFKRGRVRPLYVRDLITEMLAATDERDLERIAGRSNG